MPMDMKTENVKTKSENACVPVHQSTWKNKTAYWASESQLKKKKKAIVSQF